MWPQRSAAKQALEAERERADESIRLVTLKWQEEVESLRVSVANGTWDETAVQQLEAAKRTQAVAAASRPPAPKHAPKSADRTSTYPVGRGIHAKPMDAKTPQATPPPAPCPTTPVTTSISDARTATPGDPEAEAAAAAAAARAARLRAMADKEPEELRVSPPQPKSKEILRLEEEWEEEDVIYPMEYDAIQDPTPGDVADGEGTGERDQAADVREKAEVKHKGPSRARAHMPALALAADLE